MEHNHQVLVRLREMIADGELKPGERITEIPTAEKLGVSRLPVRMALQILEQEGLVERLPKRGYTARKITSADFLNALEVRGTLEGLAARQAAEHGMPSETVALLEQGLAELDAVFEREVFSIEEVEIYQKFNVLFHDAVIEASQNPVIRMALAKIESLPFSSIQSLVIDRREMPREKKRLLYAHLQHHAILRAVCSRQSARAEALMREHAQSPVLFTDLLNRFENRPESLHIVQDND
ncbi:GntR family transcriptional regulator [Neisseria weixii]|uniref:GntR family transcriptional regulator n=1 Tax=Neisseria weixii TaxID=1853276 RepID=UPI000BB8708B|nr:GntR family transcriptional regulator [Neisseria weixii]ATD65854.1 GntR family transcriptional regulator [Neisseria weixii]